MSIITNGEGLNKGWHASLGGDKQWANKGSVNDG
jgi:hypothetical protein